MSPSRRTQQDLRSLVVDLTIERHVCVGFRPTIVASYPASASDFSVLTISHVCRSNQQLRQLVQASASKLSVLTINFKRSVTWRASGIHSGIVAAQHLSATPTPVVGLSPIGEHLVDR